MWIWMSSTCVGYSKSYGNSMARGLRQIPPMLVDQEQFVVLTGEKVIGPCYQTRWISWMDLYRVQGLKCSFNHCTLQASKRSLKVGKGISLLDMLGKLFTSAFILWPYSISHKQVLLINYWDTYICYFLFLLFNTAESIVWPRIFKLTFPCNKELCNIKSKNNYSVCGGVDDIQHYFVKFPKVEGYQVEHFDVAETAWVVDLHKPELARLLRSDFVFSTVVKVIFKMVVDNHTMVIMGFNVLISTDHLQRQYLMCVVVRNVYVSYALWKSDVTMDRLDFKRISDKSQVYISIDNTLV